MKLLIKNMVSIRCKLLVRSILHEVGLADFMVELGEVVLPFDLQPLQKVSLQTALMREGFEIVEDKKYILIERIKNFIVEMVH